MFLHFSSYSNYAYAPAPASPLNKIRTYLTRGKQLLHFNILSNTIGRFNFIFTSVLIFTLLFAFFQVFKGYAQNIKHGVERQGDTDFGPFALAVLGATGIALAGLAQQTGALDGLLQGKN